MSTWARIINFSNVSTATGSDLNSTDGETEVMATTIATTTTHTTLLLNSSIHSFIGSWKITYEDGFEAILELDSNSAVVVISAYGRLTGSLKPMDGSWRYEIVSDHQTEHKFHLKVVDSQLVARRWTGTRWVSSASVQMTSTTEISASVTPATSTIPIWIFVAVASLAFVACQCAYWWRKRSLGRIPEIIIKDAEAAPPTLLHREHSGKRDKTAEFGTSPISEHEALDDADIELEFGLGGNSDLSIESANMSTWTSPHEDAPSFQGPSRDSVFSNFVSTVTSI
jgi:hypothetical protein